MEIHSRDSDFGEVRIFSSYGEMSDYLEGFWLGLYNIPSHSEPGLSVALSGGQTPLEFYRRMAAALGRQRAESTHVFLVDERYLPFSHENSNARSIHRSFIEPVGIPMERFYRVDTENPDVEESAL